MSGSDPAGRAGEPYAGPDPGCEPGVVRLSVAAQPHMVATARAVAAHLAGRADFDIDTIGDLRLAVDQACDSLIQIAVLGARLDFVFTVCVDRMHVDVATATRINAVVDPAGFGWQLLRALTDQTRLELGAGGRPERLAIRFTTRVPA